MNKKLVTGAIIVMVGFLISFAERAPQVAAQIGQKTEWFCVDTSSGPGQPSYSCIDSFNAEDDDILCDNDEIPVLSGCNYEGLRNCTVNGHTGQWCKCVYSCVKIKKADKTTTGGSPGNK